ncbi:predicted protein [Naegleria gruberi]|uniref:Predicted protein n=1 Tax=Naegleria gruberi TaxID=5762 RepID=D2VE56_NAEGR|nr:uncharacterized protein NAEGRDRAFT_48814 [Naegleria gruberi]EFC44824.1 predicted protein [Naegleria gruberi]|eukprot:XP_002677568.1 predicted protein [Naegleria gruberi strain NEG-M]
MYRFGRINSSRSKILSSGLSSSSNSTNKLFISNQFNNHHYSINKKNNNLTNGNTTITTQQQCFHTNLKNFRMPFDDPRFEEFLRNKRNFKHYRNPSGHGFDGPFLPEKRTLVGTLVSLVWKIITLPFKIVGSILMFGALFVGKMIFRRKLKEMEQMMTRTTLRNVKSLNTLYRNDKFTEGQIFFRDMMTGQPSLVDEVLEDCLNFMDNNQLVYERLKEEAIKRSDSMKESFSISLHDSKEKVERDNGESNKMCFSNSKFIRLVTDPQMISTRQVSGAGNTMIRRVPIFIMVKMSEKEIEQLKNAKPEPMLGMTLNEDNEILKEYKLSLPLYLDIHATYEYGEWKQFKKLDILTTEKEELDGGEILISFDELSSNDSGTSMNVGIMDAEFVEKK